MQTRTKKLTTLAMLSALAFLLTAFGRIPVVLFLKYDPKDIIIVIGGFIYGPLAAFMISFVVSFVEMLTISDTGPIGFVMNIIASCAFCCTAAVVYKTKHTLNGAAAGLLAGALLTTGLMLLWNYYLTPIYMGVPREAVAAMLIPAFLPFNLLKSGLNAALAMLIYKPLKIALTKSGLMPTNLEEAKTGVNIGVVLVSLFIVGTCAVFILIFQGII